MFYVAYFFAFLKRPLRSLLSAQMSCRRVSITGAGGQHNAELAGGIVKIRRAAFACKKFREGGEMLE